TRHDETQRIVEVFLIDAARNHRLGDLRHVGRHIVYERWIVGDEPEELGIQEILLALGVPIAIWLADALNQELRFGLDKPLKRRDIARMNGPDRLAERSISDDWAIEELNERGPVL